MNTLMLLANEGSIAISPQFLMQMLQLALVVGIAGVGVWALVKKDKPADPTQVQTLLQTLLAQLQQIQQPQNPVMPVQPVQPQPIVPLPVQPMPVQPVQPADPQRPVVELLKTYGPQLLQIAGPFLMALLASDPRGYQITPRDQSTSPQG